MSQPHDPNQTVDVTVDSVDSLEAGLAAGFGKVSGPPRSGLDPSQRPVLLREAEGESDHVIMPHSDAMPDRAEAGDRYQLFGEIARGGMGAVLRGRDVDLGRDLAVKVLLERHADNPAVARRFLEEAQIGGQLQHPGVVPVYDIGHFGDRPFFTMKLVKGKTLAAILGERTVPTEDRPRLLSIALQVSQALAYAHAKGVIHRDLKPANVMVGAFGEVQVMDWGLAKVLAEGGVADEERASRHHQHEEGTLIRTARSGSSGHGTDTEAGSMLGTPAYMPPEQANGDIPNLDRRADVFGLGAILCEILTGKPPYVGRSSEEVRRKAANGDLADALARLDGCGADADLIALTRACLSPEAVDRPKDAQAVADALTAYLDGVQERLRRAELDRVRIEGEKVAADLRMAEQRRRFRLTLALAGTVLLALTLGGGGGLWIKADLDARLARVNREVHDALTQARAVRANDLSAAREQAQRALALVQNGPADPALAAQVEHLQADLDAEEKDRQLVMALDQARLEQAGPIISELRFSKERMIPKLRVAFQAYGLEAGKGESAEVAERVRRRPSAVRQSIIAALDEWHELAGDPQLGITEPHREWLWGVLEAVEPADAWNRQVRAARREADPAKRQATLEALAKSADVEKIPASSLTRLADQLGRDRSVELLRRAAQQYPADFWVNCSLGLDLAVVRPPEFDEAVRFLTAAIALRPNSPVVRVNLAYALHKKGQSDQAIASLRKAIAIDPTFALAHTNLGSALAVKGQLEEAITCHRKAIEVDPQFALGHTNLGNVLAEKGKGVEAIASYRKAIDLDPKDFRGHFSLGNVVKDKGQVDEAIASYHKAIELHPKFAEAHYRLGNALKDKGQREEAIASYRKALELDPNLSNAHNNLGLALKDKGQIDEAIASFRKAIALDPKPAQPHNNLGSVLMYKGRRDEAIACYRKAIQIDPKLALAHSNLGVALKDKGQRDEAIACYRKAIELDPKFAVAHDNLGVALKDKGQVDEAIASFEKAIDLDPKRIAAYLHLGPLLQSKGQVDEAIAYSRKAIQIDPKSALAHECLGLALAIKGRADEAIGCCRKAIELDPKNASAHIGLGHVLQSQGRFTETLAAFRRGHELGSQQPGWPHPSAEWVRDAERMAALEARLPAFLEGEFEPKDSAERLGLARVCQAKKRNHVTARLHTDAFAADPTLADDLKAQHRYNAACCAALAATGQGKDAARLDNKERARLSKQALDWLRADLASYSKLSASGAPNARSLVQQRMKHWQHDSDLVGLRDKAALAKLPAEKRAACEKLWADVAELLNKAGTPAKKEGT